MSILYVVIETNTAQYFYAKDESNDLPWSKTVASVSDARKIVAKTISTNVFDSIFEQTTKLDGINNIGCPKKSYSIKVN